MGGHGTMGEDGRIDGDAWSGEDGGAHRAPEPQKWARWAIRRMVGADEARLVMDELRELHAHWAQEDGGDEADRRYRRQLREYPFRLLARAVREVGPVLRSTVSLRNLRHATRALRRAPALSTSIILTIGLGIGGCTAIFAVVDALLIRPLPYPDADRLVWIHTDAPPNQWPFSVADYQALVEQQTTFEKVAAYRRGVVTFTSADVADRIDVGRVTPGFFSLMGIDLASGREALEADAVPGSDRTAVVTAGFASRHLSVTGPATRAALGQSITLDGVDYRVVGVLPDDHGPLGRTADVFPTLQLEPPPRKGPFFLSVFGRLAVDESVAAEELRAINARLFPIWADSYQDEASSWGVTSLESLLLGDTDRLLLALMGAVGLLLLMATANAANLLLARVNGRRHELAVRLAVGASRARVIGYLTAESAVLALGGMAVGLGLAWGAIEVMPGIASDYVPRLSEVGLSGRVLAFAGALALLSGVVFGLISALSGSSGNLSAALRSGGRAGGVGGGPGSGLGGGPGGKRQNAQALLVVGQLGIAVPLLAGAGLLGSSFASLSAVDVGFDAETLISVEVPLAGGRYGDGSAREAFWDQAIERLTAIPSVRAVGVGSGRPPSQVQMTNNFNLEDRPTPPGASEPAVPWAIVDNGYFAALGIPLVAGRLFEPTDLDSGAAVVVVDEAWATRFFPGEEVIGRRMVSGGCTSCELTTVIGVVGTVPYLGLRRADEGAVYGHGARAYLNLPVLHIRTAGDPLDVVPAVRSVLRELDSSIPLSRFSSGESLLHEALTQPRQLSLLLSSFSLMALLLAALGLYGIMAYSVQRRRGDIAIRLALGGAPGDVLSLIVRQGLAHVAIGLALGLAGALAFTRLLSDLLFEVAPADPLTLLGVTALLLLVSVVACGVPARRAVRVDPAGALRGES
jgi:putative ABC transport system permease protein